MAALACAPALALGQTPAPEPPPPGDGTETQAPQTSGPTLTRPPEVERFVEAAYPPEAEARKLEGRVVLSIDISATGEVTRAEVVEPAGHGFDEAALAAIRQFRFVPAELDGKPSAVRITYAYDFVLRPASTASQVDAGGAGELSAAGCSSAAIASRWPAPRWRCPRWG